MSWGTGGIGMRVIKRYGKIYRDDLLKSKAVDIEKYNVSSPSYKGAASYNLPVTPLWPISEKKEGINHSSPIKNVCNTLPAFTRKNSRQGEEWPAKGNMFGFQVLGPGCSPVNHDDRMFLVKCTGVRQNSTEILLPRCRMVVGLRNPKRPHFFFGGVKVIIFCLYQLAFLYWQNREGGSPCFS
jgi:hypothetical protein